MYHLLSKKKPIYLVKGSSAIIGRPVAFRPCFSAGLAFSLGKTTKASKGNKNPTEGLKLAVLEKPLSLEFTPLEVYIYGNAFIVNK
jgi:hypothetical protein